MNRNISAAMLALVFALAPPVASACGEGQFNMGQGLRYQGYLAPHPAAVLVYDDGGSDRKALYAGLQKAGHKVTVVGDAGAMSQALDAGHFDVVIANLDEAVAVQSRTDIATSRPRVLPVIARSQRNAPDVRSRFNLFLVDGASLGQYLKLINQLLSVRVP